MNEFLKLEGISVLSRVVKELEQQTYVKDSKAAQYMIHLYDISPTVNDFIKQLEKSSADFPLFFMQNLYNILLKMKPKGAYNAYQNSFYTGEENGSEIKVERIDLEQHGNDKEYLTQKFPGLTLPNKNKEELDIHLDQIINKNAKFDPRELKLLEKEYNIKKPTKTIEPVKEIIKLEKKKTHKHKHHKHKHHHSHHKRKHSKDSDSNRSKSSRRDRNDKSSSSKSSSRKRSRTNSKSQENEVETILKKKDPELIVSGVYRGVITRVEEYGGFVKLIDFKDKKGLIHISQIRSDRKVFNAADELRQGQSVRVRIVQIDGDKISLSLKDVDQNDIKPIPIWAVKPFVKIDDKNNPIPEASFNAKYGPITGIKLETDIESLKQQKRISSPELWELSRMKNGQIYNAPDKLLMPRNEIELDDLNEERPEIDLCGEEPPFLKGQTTRTGVTMSPVRIIIMPDSSMARAVMKQTQLAKKRKENREQAQKELLEKMPGELNKLLDDPSLNLAKRDIITALDKFGTNFADLPVWKKENLMRSFGIKRSSMTIKEQRESLPIFKLKERLLLDLKEHRILIIIGETGSGKTTQIPQYLKELGFTQTGVIGCTQPRRVAAMSVAKRVSEEMGTKLGEEVGYSIRFEDCCSKKTIIKYMTDGMLLREAIIDPVLKLYSVIMLDEAHERTMHTDILFGLMKKALRIRPELRVIVTSATLDAEKFSSYFFDCPIFRIPGNTYDVEILYTKEPESDYLEAALSTVMQIHLTEPPGDILLFLTGQEEIDTACQILTERLGGLGEEAPPLIILPVYSALPSDMQSRIFDPAPPGSRKCVIATNIAEASITIDGIYYVVDPGFMKIKVYNPKLGMDTLVVAPISQASARQRAGRAGRTGPGKCYRLFTMDAYKNEMMPCTVPEIQRTNLSNTVLILKTMGINDLINFEYMDPPPVKTLVSAMEELYFLGCLDDDGLLTKLGRLMAEFPLEPQLSKMLLTSVDLCCSDEIITIVAMLSVQTVFYRPREKQSLADQKRSRFYQPDGDHLTLLAVYEGWKMNNYSNSWCYENFIHARALRRAQDVRKQLISILEKYKLPLISAGKDFDRVRKSITAGFFSHAARKDAQEGYRTLADNHQVYIHPSSSLLNKNPEWVVYHELVLTTKEYMREVSTIDPKWLTDVSEKFCKVGDPTSLSKRKKQERLEPLDNKFEDKYSWRLSRRKG